MSFHQLEDITEDAIRIIDKDLTISFQQKRDLIYSLFCYHDQQDTSYTRFRVKDILIAHHLLYGLPLEKHPLYAQEKGYLMELINEGHYWLPWESSGEKGLVFHQDEMFYFEAGSDYWQFYNQELAKEEQVFPIRISFLEMFHTLFQLGIRLSDKNFVAPWYAFLVNCLVNDDLPEDEIMKLPFLEWQQSSLIRNIRETALANLDFIQFKKHPYKGDEILSLPSLSMALYNVDSPKEKAKIRYLLEFKKTTGQIEKKYQSELQEKQKEETRKAAVAALDVENFSYIFDFFRAKLDRSWETVIQQLDEFGNYTATFFSQVKEENKYEEAVYCTFIVNYLYELNTIYLRFGFQNAAILRWQDLPPSGNLTEQHFVGSLLKNFQKLNTGEYAATDAGQYYPFKHHGSTQKKQVIMEGLWQNYLLHKDRLIDFYTCSIAKRVKGKTVKQLLREREKFNRQQLLNYFGNDLDFLLFLAQVMKLQGNKKAEDEALNQLKQECEKGVGSPNLRERIKKGIEFVTIDDGKYPQITTLFNHRNQE